MGGERLEEVGVKLQRRSLGQRRQGKAFLSRGNETGNTCDYWSTTHPGMAGKFFVTGGGAEEVLVREETRCTLSQTATGFIHRAMDVSLTQWATEKHTDF